jgi:hypothetical protein
VVFTTLNSYSDHTAGIPMWQRRNQIVGGVLETTLFSAAKPLAAPIVITFEKGGKIARAGA